MLRQVEVRDVVEPVTEVHPRDMKPGQAGVITVWVSEDRANSFVGNTVLCFGGWDLPDNGRGPACEVEVLTGQRIILEV